jgi:prevent-host-death family protein
MAAQGHGVQTMTIAEVKSGLDDVVERVLSGEHRVIVERDGIPVAVVMSPEDFRRLQEFEARDSKQRETIQEMGRALADVPIEERELYFEQVVAGARAELRAEQAGGSVVNE